MIRVCFVCLGNICRSPTAEGIMRALVADAGLAEVIEVESAGTSSYHVGDPADPRARGAARARGVKLAGRAQQFTRKDWGRFDYVLAMDRSNYEDLASIAFEPAHREKVFMLRSFDRASPEGASVPDPYYGGDDGFQVVLDVCEAACQGLLERIRRERGV